MIKEYLAIASIFDRINSNIINQNDYISSYTKSIDKNQNDHKLNLHKNLYNIASKLLISNPSSIEEIKLITIDGNMKTSIAMEMFYSGKTPRESYLTAGVSRQFMYGYLKK